MAETRTYAPLRRVLALVHFLTDRYRENPHGVFTAQELLAALADHYAGGAATRTLRGDLTALRDRSLVLTRQKYPEHARLTGAKRNGLLEKAQDLKFTAEACCFQDVRRLLGSRLPSVVATSGAAIQGGRANARVEDALLIVRVLERA